MSTKGKLNSDSFVCNGIVILIGFIVNMRPQTIYFKSIMNTSSKISVLGLWKTSAITSDSYE